MTTPAPLACPLCGSAPTADDPTDRGEDYARHYDHRWRCDLYCPNHAATIGTGDTPDAAADLARRRWGARWPAKKEST